jgi:hypothetical protein
MPLFSIVFLLANTAYSRTGTISGHITDEHNKPLPFVNVILLKTTDSTLVTAQLTNEKGDFQLTPADTGSFVLKTVLMGYEPNNYGPVQLSNENVVLPAISLSAKEQQLKEVSVRAQKPFVEVHADKIVVNVENSIVNAGNSVMDVLSHSPGVNVDQNDNISLKGKQGVNVMINGKIQPMQAADLANLLKSLPSSSVESIELISNPSARYDAAGTAGIINIKMKKEKNIGINGSVNGSYAQGVYPKESFGGTINYRNKKLNVYAGANASIRQGSNHLTLNRNFYTNDVFSKAYIQDNNYLYHFNNYMANAGLDYSLSRKTTVGGSVTADKTYFTRDAHNYSDIIDSATRMPISHFSTISNSTNQWNSIAANLNLRHSFDSTGRTLAVDLDYATYPSNGTQYYSTIYRNAAGTPVDTIPPATLSGNQSGLTQIRSLKADYVHPLKAGAKLEAGIKSSYVTADNDIKFYNLVDSTYVNDAGKTNHFVYEEMINAAYLNMSKDWTKWSIQAGLRAEQTIANGTDRTIDSSFSRNYLKLFPSFAVQRHINSNNDLGLTLSRRIERPNYEQLNPFKYYLDPTTYKSGYPYLNPATSYSFELSHVFKQRLITNINYTIVNSPITEVIQPDEQNRNITVQTTKNLALMEYFGISGSYQLPLFKWWNNTTNINAYYSRYQGDIAGSMLNKGRPTFDINTTNSFILPDNWSAELSYFYQARQQYGYMDLVPQSMLSAGVQKNFLSKKLTLRLNATDIFWDGYPRATSVYNNYKETFSARRDTRQVSCALTYRFGQRPAGQARRHSGGAEEEKRRAGGGNG